MEKDNFCGRLREERERLGYNQEDFGALGGVKKLAQFKYEKGETSPTVAYLSAISDIGVDVVYLITGRRSLVLAPLNLPADTRHERLKAERLRLVLTQEQMAKAGGVARSAQANYEKGERSPDVDYMAAVSEVGVDVAYVITGMSSVPVAAISGARETALLENFKKMADEDQRAIERLVTVLSKVESI